MLAVQTQPSSANYYNLVCGYAKLHEKDNAFNALEKAIANGFDSRKQFETYPDLDELKSDSLFQVLLAKLK